MFTKWSSDRRKPMGGFQWVDRNASVGQPVVTLRDREGILIFSSGPYNRKNTNTRDCLEKHGKRILVIYHVMNDSMVKSGGEEMRLGSGHSKAHFRLFLMEPACTHHRHAWVLALCTFPVSAEAELPNSICASWTPLQVCCYHLYYPSR